MAKDPAFLFYSSDFLSGTLTMTDEQVGKYIRLLCLLHQKGRLKEKDVLNICQRYDEDIFSKFKRDDEGLYYNEKLENVVQKRKAYSESRRKNRNSKQDQKPVSSTYVPHMENEIVSNNTSNYSGVQFSKERPPHAPLIEDVVEHFVRQGKTQEMAIRFFNHYEGLDWMKGGTPIVRWSFFANTAIANWDWSDRKSKTDQPTQALQSAEDILAKRYNQK